MDSSGELTLPIESIRQLDRNRGVISRSDFVRLLLDAYDGGTSKQRESVTQEEFTAFRQEIKDLLHKFLDFALAFGIELNNGQKRIQSKEVSRNGVNLRPRNERNLRADSNNGSAL